METSLKLQDKNAPNCAGLFLCHNSLDKDVVRHIADALELETGTAFFLDTFAIPVGEAFLPWIEDALESSSGCAIFLGGNGWGRTHLWEAEIALSRYRADPNYLLIPVALPGIIADDMRKLGAGTLFQEINWADFTRSIKDQEALAKLLSTLTGKQQSPHQGPAQLTPYQIRRDAARWQKAQMAEKASILYHGTQLAEAERIIGTNPDYVVLSEVQPFIAAAHREAQSRLKRIISAIAIATVFIAISAIAAIIAYFLAETRRLESVSRELAIASRDAPRPDRQLLTALAAFDASRTPDARGTLVELLENWGDLRRMIRLGTAVSSLEFIGEGQSFFAGTSDGRLVRLNVDDAGSTMSYDALTRQSGAVTTMLSIEDHIFLGREDGSIDTIGPDASVRQLLPAPPVLSRQDQSVLALAAYRDNLAVGRADGRLLLIDLQTGNEKGGLDIADELRVRTLAFDPLGRYLVIGGGTNRVLILDVADPAHPEISKTIPRTEGQPFAVSFDSEGHLIVLSDAGSLVLYEMQSDGYKVINRKNVDTDFISAAVINGKAGLVALGDKSGYVQVLDLYGFGCLERQRGHSGPVTTLSLAEDGYFLTSGSGDGSISLWSLGDRQGISQEHDKPPGEILAMTTDRQSLLAVAVSPGATGLWRYEKGKWLKESDLLNSSRTALGEDVFARQKSLPNAEGFIEYLGPEISLVALRPQSIAWQTRNGALLWQSISEAAGKPLVLLDSDDNDPKALTLGKDGQLVALVGEGGQIRLFDVNVPNSISYLMPPSLVRTLAIDNAGKLLAAGLESGEIALYRLGDSTPPIILAAHGSAVSGLMFSDDGEFLISYGSGGGGSDHSVAVIRLSDVSVVHHLDTRLPGGSATVMSSGKISDILAVADHDGQVQLWSLSEQRFIGSLNAGGLWIPSIHIDDSNGILWVAGSDGKLLSWDLRDNALNALACQKANRNLDETEWATLRPDDAFKRLCVTLGTINRR